MMIRTVLFFAGTSEKKVTPIEDVKSVDLKT